MQRIKKSNIGFLFLLVCLIAILALKLATDTCFLLKGTYEHADDLNVDKLQYVTSETDVPNIRENLPRNIEKTDEAIESDSHLHKNENEQLSGKRLESRSPVITGEEEENIVSDGKIQAGNSKNKRFSADENVRPRAKRSWRIKRNWRNKRATNINGTHTYVFACQNGKVSKTSLIKSCMTKYRAIFAWQKRSRNQVKCGILIPDRDDRSVHEIWAANILSHINTKVTITGQTYPYPQPSTYLPRHD